jgi:hypothetical protein
MNESNNIKLTVENTNKEPCFKCIVRNLLGGKTGIVHFSCDDCQTEYKRQAKREHERYLAETHVRVDSLGVDKEWKYKNSKCEICQMPFSQMKEKNIPQRLLDDKLYCGEHFDKVLTSRAKADTERQQKQKNHVRF